MSCAAAGMAASVRNVSTATTDHTAVVPAIAARHLKTMGNAIIGQPSTKLLNLNMVEKGEGKGDVRSLGGTLRWLQSQCLIYKFYLTFNRFVLLCAVRRPKTGNKRKFGAIFQSLDSGTIPEI